MNKNHSGQGARIETFCDFVIQYDKEESKAKFEFA